MCRVKHLLAEYLSDPPVPVIAKTTPKGLDRILEQESPLLEHYVPVNVQGAAGDQAAEMIRVYALFLADQQGVQIHDQILDDVMKLADAFLKSQRQPGAGIDVLEQAASIASLRAPFASEDLARLNSLRMELAQSREKAIQNRQFEEAATLTQHIESSQRESAEYLQRLRKEQSTNVTREDVIQAVRDLAQVELSRVSDASSGLHE